MEICAKRKREKDVNPAGQMEKCRKVDYLMSRRVNPLRITGALKEAKLSRAVYDRCVRYYLMHLLMLYLMFFNIFVYIKIQKWQQNRKERTT